MSIPNNRLQGFLFKVIPLEYNALSHSSLSCFYVLLEGFFWYALHLHHYSPLDGLDTFNMTPLDDLLKLEGKEKSPREQDQVNREVVPVWQYSSQSGTAEHSVHPVLLLFRHVQIFGDYLLDIVFFISSWFVIIWTVN